MMLYISMYDVSVRLSLTVAAGALIGFNRDEGGRAAGLRTMILVCLAASVAMIQVNLLLSTAGKSTTSFVTLDLMRLPLGILSGVGFLGGGAILRRGDRVQGLTTAATLWLVTVIGLCFGGGQLLLGGICTGLGWIVLTAMKLVEVHIPKDHHITLRLCMASDKTSDVDVPALLRDAGMKIVGEAATFDARQNTVDVQYDLRLRTAAQMVPMPITIRTLSAVSGVHLLIWQPQGFSSISKTP